MIAVTGLHDRNKSNRKSTHERTYTSLYSCHYWHSCFL